MAGEFDVVIVGGGPTGEHAAGRARRRGLSVALVEEELVGGECSYWACMPSKTLIRPGHVLAEARAVPGAAAAVVGELDAQAALERRDWMVSSWSDEGQARWLAEAGAVLVRGHGRLSAERTVTVEAADGERTLRAARAVVLAVGSGAAVPPIPGLAESRFWTNREATAAKRIPERLLVLGGGVVGVELAQAFARLGSTAVTVLEGADRLVATAEPFVSELLAEAFAKEGIAVRVGAKVTGVDRRSDGSVVATLEDGSSVSGDELLVAVGRRPRTNDLGLEAIGLSPGGYLPTSGTLAVEGVEGGWLYAIGDATGKALLTHMGKYQARVAIDSIVGDAVLDEADHGIVTAVVFTDPEVGSVGLTEDAARAAGHAVRVVAVELEEVAAGAIWGEGIVGRCQLVLDAYRQVVLGATFVGPGMGEALHAATVAVAGAVPLERLRHAVPAFPTLSEVWLELVDRALSR